MGKCARGDDSQKEAALRICLGDEAGIDGADVVVRLRAGRIGRAGIAKAVARVPQK